MGAAFACKSDCESPCNSLNDGGTVQVFHVGRSLQFEDTAPELPNPAAVEASPMLPEDLRSDELKKYIADLSYRKCNDLIQECKDLSGQCPQSVLAAKKEQDLRSEKNKVIEMQAVKKKELKSVLSKFVSKATNGIPCSVLNIVDGVAMLKLTSTLFLDQDMGTVKLVPKKSPSKPHVVSLATVHALDYDRLRERRPGNDAIKVLTPEEQKLSALLVFEDGTIISILVQDETMKSEIVIGLQILSARAKTLASKEFEDRLRESIACSVVLEDKSTKPCKLKLVVDRRDNHKTLLMSSCGEDVTINIKEIQEAKAAIGESLVCIVLKHLRYVILRFENDEVSNDLVECINQLRSDSN